MGRRRSGSPLFRQRWLRPLRNVRTRPEQSLLRSLQADGRRRHVSSLPLTPRSTSFRRRLPARVRRRPRPAHRTRREQRSGRERRARVRRAPRRHPHRSLLRALQGDFVALSHRTSRAVDHAMGRCKRARMAVGVRARASSHANAGVGRCARDEASLTRNRRTVRGDLAVARLQHGAIGLTTPGGGRRSGSRRRCGALPRARRPSGALEQGERAAHILRLQRMPPVA